MVILLRIKVYLTKILPVDVVGPISWPSISAILLLLENERFVGNCPVCEQDLTEKVNSYICLSLCLFHQTVKLVLLTKKVHHLRKRW